MRHGNCGRPPPPFHQPALAVPRSAVPELGVARRRYPHHESVHLHPIHCSLLFSHPRRPVRGATAILRGSAPGTAFTCGASCARARVQARRLDKRTRLEGCGSGHASD